MLRSRGSVFAIGHPANTTEYKQRRGRLGPKMIKCISGGWGNQPLREKAATINSSARIDESFTHREPEIDCVLGNVALLCIHIKIQTTHMILTITTSRLSITWCNTINPFRIRAEYVSQLFTHRAPQTSIFSHHHPHGVETDTPNVQLALLRT